MSPADTATKPGEFSDFDAGCMRRALELAARGRGAVEPNPMVGCVIVHDGQIVGEGWHERFGRAHAEVNSLAACIQTPRGGTAYVTLEPCCHSGKTPPCSDALIAAGIARVVVAQADPFPQVSGGGIKQLQAAGIAVGVGLFEAEARRLNAPYLKLLTQKRPWVIAKWAMSLDGRIATRRGDSRWISGEESRQLVHQLRGQVDAILIGSGTAVADDPLLTARPAGPRVATRIVLDSHAALPLTSQLIRTLDAAPVMVVAGPGAEAVRCEQLRAAGCEMLKLAVEDYAARLGELLDELGNRRMTNVLVEGGGRVLGALADARLIDEVQVFIAPKIIGGQSAPGPIGGVGIEQISAALRLTNIQQQMVGDDIFVRGLVAK